jgi:hypothetical protein
MAARPLQCEYALGPTFTLSDKDQARLTVLLMEAKTSPEMPGWEPVGWYHSHTRSGISMSGRDLDIYDRFFPGPMQIALVVLPHAMQPARAGFFFREADGAIHADGSYLEFQLEAGVPASRGVPASLATATPAAVRTRGSWWRFWWPALLLGAAAILLLFKTEAPRVLAADRPPSLSLTACDLNGQLQIRWDGSARAIRSAEAGTLDIADGTVQTRVALEKQMLREGSVCYERIGGRVDVRLTVRRAGAVSEELTMFVGRAPEPGFRKQQMEEQAAHIGDLERAVAGLRWLIRSGGR